MHKTKKRQIEEKFMGMCADIIHTIMKGAVDDPELDTSDPEKFKTLLSDHLGVNAEQAAAMLRIYDIVEERRQKEGEKT